MKTLAVLTLLTLSAVTAPAANIAIKNDTGISQKLVVYQDGRIAGYVDRLKPGKTLLVKVNDAGSKPIVGLYVAGEQEFLFVPAKTRVYKLSWLRNLLW